MRRSSTYSGGGRGVRAGHDQQADHRGVKLGNYERISAAKQEATRARYETVWKPIEATAELSANAAARLNERGVTTAAGGAWRAEQVLRVRRQLGL